MPDNSANIVLTASADGVLRAAEQVKKKFSEMGEAAGKASQGSFEQMGMHLLRMTAILKVVKGVAEAYNEIAIEAGKVARTAGGNQLSAELAGHRVGLKSTEVDKFLNAKGPLSASERVGFLNAMAGARGPGDRPVTHDAAMQMMEIMQGGTADQGDLLSAYSKRGRSGLEGFASKDRLSRASLSDKASGFLSSKAYVSDFEQRTNATGFGQNGQDAMIFEAAQPAWSAENPKTAAFDRSMTKLPFGLGGFYKEFTEALSRSLQSTPITVKPRLNDSANGPGGN